MSDGQAVPDGPDAAAPREPSEQAREGSGQALDAMASAVRWALEARQVLIATRAEGWWTVRGGAVAAPAEWGRPVRLLGVPNPYPWTPVNVTVSMRPAEWQLTETSMPGAGHVAMAGGDEVHPVLLLATGVGVPDVQARLRELVEAAGDVVNAADRGQRERLRESLQEREDERRRWARELHDETLQQLGALQVLLTSVRQPPDSAAQTAWKDMAAALGQAVELVSSQIVSLRHLITELRPAALDELGLRPPLEALAERTEQLTGLRVDVQVSLPYADGLASTRLMPDVELAVYRVVQEALANAARHSGGTVVVVRVVEEGDQVRVDVSDNGTGLDRPTGFGIDGMRERASLAGGRLEVTTQHVGKRRAGTTVRMVVPALHRQDEEATDEE